MKKTEIRPGVVYAEHPSYGPPDPVVFLDTKLYRIHRYDHTHSLAGPTYARPERGRLAHHGGVGYLVMRMGGWGHQGTLEERLEALRTLDIKAELQRWLDKQEPSQPGLKAQLIYSLNKIHGEYDAELAAYNERQAAKDKAYAERQAASRAAEERCERAVARLNELAGTSAYSTSSRFDAWTAVNMSAKDAERIAELLEGRRSGHDETG